MEIDFGKTAKDYKAHRQGFPPSFFERLEALGIIRANKKALDIGTGTGTIARGMALAGCVVTGIDVSTELMEQAKVLDNSAGVEVTYHVAPAEETGLPDSSFDVVTAGQCWHWFDGSRAATEIKRLLLPDGKIVIAHLDWIPLAGNVVQATENLILKYNPQWMMGGGTGLYPAWLTDLATAGFKNLETFSYDLNLSYTHTAWRGRIRASAGVAASLSPDEVEKFDAELSALLQQNFPDDPLQIHHRVWALIATKSQ